MLYLVAYDIASPKRLRRVYKFALDTGEHLQKSLFRWNLPEALFTKRWAQLKTLINPKEDAIAAYPLCQSCCHRAHQAGLTPTIQPPAIYLF